MNDRDDVLHIDLDEDDEGKSGPDPERLDIEEDFEDAGRIIMGAGRPDDEDDPPEDEG